MGALPQAAGPVVDVADPVVDLVDDTFVACDPATVAAVVADPRRWSAWWPDLRLTTTRDRGHKGMQWAVQGALVGTAEIWLEPWWDGVLLHFYLRADPARGWGSGGDGPGERGDEQAGASRGGDRQGAAVRAARLRQHRAQLWKRAVHRLKDELEHGRRPGDPSWVPVGASPVGMSSVGASSEGEASE